MALKKKKVFKTKQDSFDSTSERPTVAKTGLNMN